ncbi:hypothetical protein IKF57_00885 [Candidatus Saccharibacteria bacterium]|nr:hypothetical protein [Candidatus Saccharibacteria bacterium]
MARRFIFHIKTHYILHIVALLFGICSVSWLVLRAPRTTAQSAGASVTVAAACSFAGTVNSAHTASIPAGTYKDSIGETVFNAVCNDPYGYSIYAIGYSNNEYGNNKLLATIGGVLTPAGDIVTGTATSGNTSNWSMKMIPVTGTSTPVVENGYGDYNVIPATTTKIASFPSVTDMTTGSSIKATYAANISGNQPAGNYDGKVKFIMVHPATDTPLEPITCNAGKICYTPNARGVADSMSDQSTSSNSAVDLWPSNFKRDGYGFAGWNTEYDYSGTTYGPIETITTPDLSTTGLALYAYWIKSAGDLQGRQGCDSLASGTVTALTDTRDNNVYAVAKLADGKCWMIENLRLGGSSAMNLTTGNTVTAFTLPASTNTFTTSNSTTIEMSAKNTLEVVSNMTGTSQEVYSYGNYYSWPAAIGSTTLYGTKNQSVNTSICPSGWHLPKGGDKNNTSNSEFWKLIVTGLNNGTNPANYSSNDRPYYTGYPEGTNVSKLVRSYPNNFLYSGYLNGSSFDARGSSGFYWSSTVSGSGTSCSLNFYPSNVHPGTPYNSTYRGFSVRCVAGDMPVTISDAYAEAGKIKQNGYYKMQDMSDSICGMVDVIDEPGQTQLIDTRDNKTYWVAKLQDGKCWMTQNLDLDLSTSTALTPSDSDVTANWTPTRGTIDASAVTNNSISNWSNDYNTPYSVDPGNVYWNAFPFYASTANLFMNNDFGSNPVKFQRNTAFSTNGEHGHVGNYYNWPAAVAMNSTSSYTSDTISNPTNNPQTSICPKGWRLPTISDESYTTNGTTNEFARLANVYANYTGSTSLSSENLEKAPLYFVRSGYVDSSQQSLAGYDGYYWSSSVYSSSYAYYLYFKSAYVNPTNGSYRNRSGGLSVRCVAR